MRDGRWMAVAIFVATVAQLAVGAFADLDQFDGKAFGTRLVAYPVMMLVAPVAWFITRRVRGGLSAPPWWAFALIMAPFLIDVTGNTLDLYDRVWWWDDANHFANWALLAGGLGVLVVRGRVRPAWAAGMLVIGLGAILAIAWELGEWYSFIRHGTERTTAYEDTLGDEALGTLGAAVAGLAVWWHARRHPDPPPEANR